MEGIVFLPPMENSHGLLKGLHLKPICGHLSFLRESNKAEEDYVYVVGTKDNMSPEDFSLSVPKQFEGGFGVL